MTYIRLSSISLLITCVLAVFRAQALVNPVQAVTDNPSATSVVGFYRAGSIPTFCTGVLIAPRWILTIAHCIDDWSDRSNPESRDVTITTGQPEIGFASPTQTQRIAVDRVVRVDGSRSLTNSLALMHLVGPAPAWSRPIPLYVGGLPPSTEVMDIFGYAGNVRRGGNVNISGKAWRDTDKFWSLQLHANPSSLQRGDSGGPVLITRGGRKRLIGINWNIGGNVASVFDIDEDGHTNPVGCLIDRIINGPRHVLDAGIYELKAMHSDKCLDVAGSNLADGADIIQFRCANTTNQRWRLRASTRGYYDIVALHSGKCVDVSGSNVHNLAEIIQYRCSGTTNQQWRVTERSSDAYEIQARHSCKCLDVSQSSLADEADIIQYKCTNSPNQRWNLTELSSPTRYELQFLNVECFDALNPRDELMIYVDGRKVWDDPRDIDNNGTMGSPRNVSLDGLNYGVRGNSRVAIELEEVDATHNDELGDGYIDIAEIVRNDDLGRRLELNINNVESSNYVIDYRVIEVSE